jgi:hypothetical protein
VGPTVYGTTIAPAFVSAPACLVVYAFVALYFMVRRTRTAPLAPRLTTDDVQFGSLTRRVHHLGIQERYTLTNICSAQRLRRTTFNRPRNSNATGRPRKDNQ